MTQKASTQQKTLPLNLRAECIFQTFIEGQNSDTLHALRNFLAPTQTVEDQLFFIWGKNGTGKSHLLQAAAHYMNNMGKSAFYVSFDAIEQLNPAVLEQLEHYDLLCLDNIDAIPDQGAWEEHFFCCLNAIEENTTSKIIVSSSQNIHQLDCRRVETRSRLASGTCYQMQTLQEQDLIEAFKIRAKYRQIPMGDDAIQYMLHHVTRDSKTLFDLLNILDAKSLQEKKLISVPFVKKMIAQHFPNTQQSS